jgi:hypothetical protein
LLIHKLYSSLELAVSILSLLHLHRSLLGYSLLTSVISHAFTPQELHSLNCSWSSLYSIGTDSTGNVSSIIVCSLVAEETCPNVCSLATAVYYHMFTQLLLGNGSTCHNIENYIWQ